MSINRRTFLGGALSASLGTTLSTVAGLSVTASEPVSAAQPSSMYPNRAVSLVVGAPPGGSNDIVARLLTQRLNAKLGGTFLVDNRPGASGARAAEYVTRQPADGYTLLMTNVGMEVLNPILFADSHYDPLRDDVAIAMIGTITNILVVTPSLPVHSVAELIAYAKAHPGKLNFGSAGTGGSVHLAGELFKMRTGVQMTHVPYRGSGPMVTDLMAGVVQLAFDNFPSSIGAVNAGSLRALAVTSEKRWPLAPELPTMEESGVPNFNISTWFGVSARAGTPAPIVTQLNRAIADICQEPNFVDHLASIGAIPYSFDMAKFPALLVQEHNRWKEIIDGAHVKIE